MPWTINSLLNYSPDAGSIRRLSLICHVCAVSRRRSRPAGFNHAVSAPVGAIHLHGVTMRTSPDKWKVGPPGWPFIVRRIDIIRENTRWFSINHRRDEVVNIGVKAVMACARYTSLLSSNPGILRAINESAFAELFMIEFRIEFTHDAIFHYSRRFGTGKCNRYSRYTL